MSSPPAWPGDFPDPFVLRDGTDYWAYGTNAGGRNVQVLRSADLVEWQAAGDALPRMPAWSRPGLTWAPVVLSRPGGWILYVTVREVASDRQAVMVASASSPGGPFRPDGDGPLVAQRDLGGSIDPSPFVDTDGRAYLLWKADANAIGRPSSLWLASLADDGRSLGAPPTEVLRFGGGWERPLIEAPSLVFADGRYYLFYSGGWWESDGYGVGYAVAEHPEGPWRKVTERRPWLSSDADVSGPGGQEVFTDPDGAAWMAYHGWQPGRIGYRAGGRRTLRLARLTFEDGAPVLHPGPTADTGGAPPSRPVTDGPGSWWRRLLARGSGP